MRPWTVLVPLKAAAGRKSRLAGRLSQGERREITNHLFEHVVSTIAACSAVHRVVALAAECPPGWSGPLVVDQGRGLNTELTEATLFLDEPRLAIIHADLPQLSMHDVAVLLATADALGAAIAPDRHGSGTNALALHFTQSFCFAFGPGSFGRHAMHLPSAGIVRRPGLAFDLDTPEDFDLAIEAATILLPERNAYA